MMNQWYYAKGGQQHGPVPAEELRALILSGAIDPASDLCWNPTMSDWLPVAQIPELSGGAVPAAAMGDAYGSQPFAYQTATGALTDIAPGSEPIIPTACVKRAFDLTVKHIGPILAVVIIWFAISIVVSLLLQGFDKMMGWTPTNDFYSREFGSSSGLKTSYNFGGSRELSFVSSIISTIVSVFFMMGATRIGLNIVSGKPFDVGMLFSGGKFLVKGFFAYLLYWIMIVVGLILLIVPGVIVIVRLGMYQNAIVDRNMGIIESFKYSWELTRGNSLNLFIVFLFSILVILAGCLALFIGMLFAFPMMWLMWTVSYRWMQYGGRAVLDDPMTQQPLLASLPD
jgi:uncharacterized membrane protein